MASVRFRTKNSKREESIYLRFKPGLKGDYEVSTGIKVPKGKFSNALQRINQTDRVDYESLNRKLRELKIHVRKQFDLDNLEGVIIDNSWLRNTIKTYCKRKRKVWWGLSELLFGTSRKDLTVHSR